MFVKLKHVFTAVLYDAPRNQSWEHDDAGSLEHCCVQTTFICQVDLSC